MSILPILDQIYILSSHTTTVQGINGRFMLLYLKALFTYDKVVKFILEFKSIDPKCVNFDEVRVGSICWHLNQI